MTKYLYKLTKKRSPHYILFEVSNKLENKDKWFIDINKYKNKDNTIVDTCIIIEKDINDHLSLLTNNNWEIEK